MFQIHGLAFIPLVFWLRLEDLGSSSRGGTLFNLGFLRGFAAGGGEFVVVGGDGRGFAFLGFAGGGLGFGFGSGCFGFGVGGV